jgi:hypothetical protein
VKETYVETLVSAVLAETMNEEKESTLNSSCFYRFEYLFPSRASDTTRPLRSILHRKNSQLEIHSWRLVWIYVGSAFKSATPNMRPKKVDHISYECRGSMCNIHVSFAVPALLRRGELP